MLILSKYVQKALSLSNRHFNRLFGVKQQTFNQMLEILQAAFDTLHQAEGSVHDFTLYKNSTGMAVSPDMKIKADSGYQGIAAYHANSEVPFKKSKNCPLLPEEKLFNRRWARERVVIEHVHLQINVFRIMSDRYRNRHRRHGLRMTLICAFRNCEIKHNTGERKGLVPCKC